MTVLPPHRLRGWVAASSLLALLTFAACAGVKFRPVTEVDLSATERRIGIFDRFDHRRHDATFLRIGLGCIGCHAMGSLADPAIGGRKVPLDERKYVDVLVPPKGICHGCHQPGQMIDAPTQCRLCHELGDVPWPETHGAGWETGHAREAEAQPGLCADCHTEFTCVQCHMRRDKVGTEVHTGNWETIHGMAARADPAYCETCHEASTCQQCHLDETGRQGW